MTSLVISVPEIDCHHCKVAIESAVGAMPGVERVQVDLDTRMVAVELDTSLSDPLEVVAAIEEQGYEVPAQAGL
jgi:copper chaperone